MRKQIANNYPREGRVSHIEDSVIWIEEYGEERTFSILWDCEFAPLEYTRLRGHLCPIKKGTHAVFSVLWSKEQITEIHFPDIPDATEGREQGVVSPPARKGEGVFAIRSCGCPIFIPAWNRPTKDVRISFTPVVDEKGRVKAANISQISY